MQSTYPINDPILEINIDNYGGMYEETIYFAEDFSSKMIGNLTITHIYWDKVFLNMFLSENFSTGVLPNEYLGISI